MSRLPLAATLAFLTASALYLVQAVRLPLGSVEQPGPGLFPVLVGAFLLAAGAAFLLQSLRRTLSAPTLPPPETRGRVTGVVVALVAFCLLLPWLGYGVTAFGLLLVILRLFGLDGWALTGAVALVATVASYYLFAAVLGVPLPAGLWDH